MRNGRIYARAQLIATALLLSTCTPIGGALPPGTLTAAVYAINTALDRRAVAIKTRDDLRESELRLLLFDAHPRVKVKIYRDQPYLVGFVADRAEVESIAKRVAQLDLPPAHTFFMVHSEHSPGYFDDLATAAEIETALLDDPNIGYHNVFVLTAGGAAFLIGEVDSNEERLRARFLLERLNFKEIHNHLTVSPRSSQRGRPTIAPAKD